MTTTLREEYAQYKTHKERIVDDASFAWVKKNVILVNERIDRKTVNRLTNSIIKFDEEFGPYKEQLPAIQDVIDKAEEGLRLVLTGKTSDTRASEMLKKLSFIYSLLSDFFSADLPVLLKTPIFSGAKSEPDKRLDSMTGPGNIEDIKKVFENALRPTKEELKLYHKVYKGIPMPSLKASEISQQLLGLSYNDLLRLTGVEKVPLVVTHGPPGDNYPEPTDVLEETDSLEEQGDQQGPKNELIKQMGMVSSELTKLKPAIDIMSKEPFEPIIGTSYGNFIKQVKAALATGNQAKIEPFLAQSKLVLSTFKALGNVSKAVQPLFADNDKLDANDLKQLTTILTKALGAGGFFQRIKANLAAALGADTRPPKGLDPNTIIQTLIKGAKKEAEAEANPAEQPATQQQQPGMPATQTPVEGAPVEESVNEYGMMKETSQLLEQLEKAGLQKLFQLLGKVSAALSPEATGAAPQAKPTDPTQRAPNTGGTSTPTTQTPGTAPTAPAGQGEPAKPQEPGKISTLDVAKVLQSAGIGSQRQQQAVIDSLKKLGVSIS